MWVIIGFDKWFTWVIIGFDKWFTWVIIGFDKWFTWAIIGFDKWFTWAIIRFVLDEGFPNERFDCGRCCEGEGNAERIKVEKRENRKKQADIDSNSSPITS